MIKTIGLAAAAATLALTATTVPAHADTSPLRYKEVQVAGSSEVVGILCVTVKRHRFVIDGVPMAWSKWKARSALGHC